MRMGARVDQRKDVAEFRIQLRSVIAHNKQAAASIRPIQSEGCDDGVAAGRWCEKLLANVQGFLRAATDTSVLNG